MSKYLLAFGCKRIFYSLFHLDNILHVLSYCCFNLFLISFSIYFIIIVISVYIFNYPYLFFFHIFTMITVQTIFNIFFAKLVANFTIISETFALCSMDFVYLLSFLNPIDRMYLEKALLFFSIFLSFLVILMIIIFYLFFLRLFIVFIRS